ncbi:MAG TPA: invasion associated locus B family protein, partial [Alphaproteobacteria bacterium]|nr:invasion associated locus B family protein [Alphaproteobacteria bacterium]
MTLSAIRTLLRRRALLFAGVVTILTAGATLILTNAFAAGKADKAAAGGVKTESLWTVRCQESDKKREHCEVFQRLIVKETGARAAEFAIGFPEDKNVARGVIVLPLGMLL